MELLTPKFELNLLRKVHVTGNPINVLYLDTETSAERDTTYERHKFKLGVSCGSRYDSDGSASREVWRVHRDSLSLCRYISQLVTSKTTLYIFAHNAFFDLQVSGVFHYLPQWGWNLQFYYDEGLTYLLLITKEQGSIKILSTTNFYECSVKFLGKMVGLPKFEVDFNTASMEELEVYCRRDVEIIKRAMEHYFSFIRKHDLGTFKLTKPSQAFYAFRYRFMDKKIYIHTYEPVKKLERHGYFGGRVECFFIGKCGGGPFVTLDVNSMYPFVMRNGVFPTKLIDYKQQTSIADTEDVLKTFSAVARVVVDTDTPLYALRCKHKTIFPVGQFETVVCTPALIEAIKRKHLVEVLEIAVYQHAELFTSFVDTLYKLKLKFKLEKKDIEEYVVKKLLNAFYGKWAQKKPYVEEAMETSYHGYYRDEVIDLVTGKKEIQYKLFNKIIRMFGEEEGNLSSTVISAHITELARLYLWRIMEETGLERVLYCDTDSIKIRKSDLEYVTVERSEEKLGALKIEDEYNELEIIGLKAYRTEKIRRIKGIPKDAVEIAFSMFEYTSFLRQSTHMRQRVSQDVLVRRVIKKLTTTYEKGSILPSGRVVPFHVSQSTPLSTQLPALF